MSIFVDLIQGYYDWWFDVSASWFLGSFLVGVVLGIIVALILTVQAILKEMKEPSGGDVANVLLESITGVVSAAFLGFLAGLVFCFVMCTLPYIFIPLTVVGGVLLYRAASRRNATSTS